MARLKHSAALVASHPFSCQAAIRGCVQVGDCPVVISPTTITPQPPSRLKVPAYRSFAAPCLKTVRLARSCSRLVRWARKLSRYKCGVIVRHGRKRPTGDICIHRVGRNLQIHRDRQPPGQNRTRFGRHACKQTREAWRGEPSTSSVSRIAVVGGDCPETWGNCVRQSHYHRCGREHSRQRGEPHASDRGKSYGGSAMPVFTCGGTIAVC
jgi:hypothetical protein